LLISFIIEATDNWASKPMSILSVKDKYDLRLGLDWLYQEQLQGWHIYREEGASLVGGYMSKLDFLLIDAPAGVSRDGIVPLAIADDVILVVNPELSAIVDAMKAKILTEVVGGHVYGAIVNRQGIVVRGHLDRDTGARHHSIDDLERRLANAEGSTAPQGNTTLTVVVTNQKLRSRALRQFARQVHTSMARAIQPFPESHWPGDGDHHLAFRAHGHGRHPCFLP
jgi:septum formation inhibitor-activating ATPase MinD